MPYWLSLCALRTYIESIFCNPHVVTFTYLNIIIIIIKVVITINGLLNGDVSRGSKLYTVDPSAFSAIIGKGMGIDVYICTLIFKCI
jgi:hypothetical protein